MFLNLINSKRTLGNEKARTGSFGKETLMGATLSRLTSICWKD